MTGNSTVEAKEKTVYLIRHAESEENRKTAALKNLGKFSLPSWTDLSLASGLINYPAMVDSDVSQVGQHQIEIVAAKLKQDQFLESNKVTLVAHSPLKRARMTSEGILGCVAPDTKARSVQNVEETALLVERTASEWTYNLQGLADRISAFESWLGKQPHDKIAVVGHSQFFKAMLGLSFKFGNCEVWQLSFDPTSANGNVTLDKSDHTTHGNADEYTVPRGWSQLKRLYTCEVKEDIVGEINGS